MQEQPRSRFASLIWKLRDNKRASLLAMGAVLVALIIVVVLVIAIGGGDDGQQNADTISIDLDAGASDLDVVQRRIDGVPVEVAQANSIPAAVMIENLLTVRPQSGLGEAQVVYETLAEGGITRFLAVYAGGADLERIGPVRSARHYFVDIAEEYQGLYMHAGGSPQALGQLRATDNLVADLNQIGGAHTYYYRDPSIAAPHNLFTSSELMAFAYRDLEIEDDQGTYDGWNFTAAVADEEDRPESQSFTLPFSSAAYAAQFAYNPEENAYYRSNGGEPHIDAATGEQIAVSTVIVQSVPVSLLEADTGRLDIDVIGEGDATFFANGQMTMGRWSKSDSGERTQFTTADGEEMEFIPGSLWVALLPDDRSIEYN